MEKDRIQILNELGRLIQNMGQRLEVAQLVINTTFVYMHRFFSVHPINLLSIKSFAQAAIYLAAKVEEQPRSVEQVIYAYYHSFYIRLPVLDADFIEHEIDEILVNENLLLSTFGFNLNVNHPHPFIVRFIQKTQAPKNVATTAYHAASHSLRLTPMCLKYPSLTVAAFCIYLSAKWLGWEIKRPAYFQHWYHYFGPHVSLELLQNLARKYELPLAKMSGLKFVVTLVPPVKQELNKPSPITLTASNLGLTSQTRKQLLQKNETLFDCQVSRNFSKEKQANDSDYGFNGIETDPSKLPQCNSHEKETTAPECPKKIQYRKLKRLNRKLDGLPPNYETPAKEESTPLDQENNQPKSETKPKIQKIRLKRNSSSWIVTKSSDASSIPPPAKRAKPTQVIQNMKHDPEEISTLLKESIKEDWCKRNSILTLVKPDSDARQQQNMCQEENNNHNNLNTYKRKRGNGSNSTNKRAKVSQNPRQPLISRDTQKIMIPGSNLLNNTQSVIQTFPSMGQLVQSYNWSQNPNSHQRVTHVPVIHKRLSDSFKVKPIVLNRNAIHEPYRSANKNIKSWVRNGRGGKHGQLSATQSNHQDLKNLPLSGFKIPKKNPNIKPAKVENFSSADEKKTSSSFMIKIPLTALKESVPIHSTVVHEKEIKPPKPLSPVVPLSNPETSIQPATLPISIPLSSIQNILPESIKRPLPELEPNFNASTCDTNNAKDQNDQIVSTLTHGSPTNLPKEQQNKSIPFRHSFINSSNLIEPGLQTEHTVGMAPFIRPLEIAKDQNDSEPMCENDSKSYDGLPKPIIDIQLIYFNSEFKPSSFSLLDESLICSEVLDLSPSDGKSLNSTSIFSPKHEEVENEIQRDNELHLNVLVNESKQIQIKIEDENVNCDLEEGEIVE